MGHGWPLFGIYSFQVFLYQWFTAHSVNQLYISASLTGWLRFWTYLSRCHCWFLALQDGEVTIRGRQLVDTMSSWCSVEFIRDVLTRNAEGEARIGLSRSICSCNRSNSGQCYSCDRSIFLSIFCGKKRLGDKVCRKSDRAGFEPGLPRWMRACLFRMKLELSLFREGWPSSGPDFIVAW